MTETTETSSSLDPKVRDRLDAVWQKAYGARTREDLLRLYSEWAATYDEDHEAVGFFSHRNSAELLARYVNRPEVDPILDAGAGTGAAGMELARLGFQDITALDLSPEMLEVAAKKGVYRRVLPADLGEPLDMFPSDQFAAAVLVGVFSYGQAPAHAIDEIVRLVRPGGVVVFTMRTDFHANDAMGVRSRMEQLEHDGVWRFLEATEPAQYLPKKDPSALFQVWCYRVLPGKRYEDTRFAAGVRQAVAKGGDVMRLDHAFIWNSTASRLYEDYTRTPQYYLTNCEVEILARNADEILGGESMLVELGCGSARKINELLDARLKKAPKDRTTYVPIDLSPGALTATQNELVERYGGRIEILPEEGRFQEILPALDRERRKLILFFGSSIGNLESVEEMVGFLREAQACMQPGDRLVVGMDLHKKKEDILSAYRAGKPCLSFFLNMVRRMNDVLGADFDLQAFEQASSYEQEEPEYEGLRTWRVDFKVATNREQYVYFRDLDLEFYLPKGGAVQSGISRKFEAGDIRKLGELAGLKLSRQWLDTRKWFSLNEFVVAEGRGA